MESSTRSWRRTLPLKAVFLKGDQGNLFTGWLSARGGSESVPESDGTGTPGGYWPATDRAQTTQLAHRQDERPCLASRGPCPCLRARRKTLRPETRSGPDRHT